MRNLRAIVSTLAMPMLLAACSGPQPRQDRFEATGELIVLGGGDAGARAACVTCHGLQGEGDGNLSPRLAGLNAGYIARQMEHFASGQRRHPQMTWIAARLDWPARQKVAHYYAQLPGPESAASTPEGDHCAAAELYHQGDARRGLPSCASCHGDAGAGQGEGNPPLAAQPAVYLEAQLKAWESGERYGDRDMLRISRLLTEEEMARLAGYSSALPGAIGYPEPPAACPRTRRPDPRSDA